MLPAEGNYCQTHNLSCVKHHKRTWNPLARAAALKPSATRLKSVTENSARSESSDTSFEERGTCASALHCIKDQLRVPAFDPAKAQHRGTFKVSLQHPHGRGMIHSHCGTCEHARHQSTKTQQSRISQQP